MPVVRGVKRFARAMSAHADDYVLIGGGACSILFDEAGQSFRATDDLDVVVVADGSNAGFARALWAFVAEGGYEAGTRPTGRSTYYRFRLPEGSRNIASYPAQIELFARRPDFPLSSEASEVTPLPFDETVSSLSAIILDDECYEFIRDNAIPKAGVTMLDAIHIIPLKMRAHIDLNRRHDEGLRVNDRDLRKHRADVAKLAGLLTPDARLGLRRQMRRDAEDFLDDFERYAARHTQRKHRGRLQETLVFLRGVYL